MADGTPQNQNHVRLDRLSDHDLLVRIATKLEDLPGRIDANEERSRANEREIARLDERQKTANKILLAVQVLGSTIAGAIGIAK